MMSRRYVRMREYSQGRRVGSPAPLEPLYETERKAMTAEALGERERSAGKDAREHGSSRPGVRVGTREDR